MSSSVICQRRFDFIVIGAGAAGCAVASSILTKHPNAVLALLEMGCGEASPLLSKLPLGRAVLPWSYKARKFMTSYETEPEPGLGNRRLVHTRGTCLGGNSQFDSTWYLRGAKTEYDRWEQPAWTFDKMLPAYKKMERATMECSDELHGSNGPLTVSSPSAVSTSLSMNLQFAHACEAGGISSCGDVNSGVNTGCFVYQKRVEDGMRDNVFQKLILHRVLAFPDLSVLPDTKAEKLLLDESGKRVTGVQVVSKGKPLELEAKNIVCCCGAIETPLLLQRSGIGPGSLLAQHDIPVRVDNPHVGENLIESTSIDVVYNATIPHAVRHKSLSLRNGFYMLQQFREWCDAQTGQMASMEEVGCNLRSHDQVPSPDLHLTMRCLQWIDRGNSFSPFNGFTLSAEHTHPSSRGQVHIGGSSATSKPKIVGNHLSTEDDVNALLEGLRYIRRLVDMEKLLKHEYFEGPFGFISPLQQYRPTERYPAAAAGTSDTEILLRHAVGNGELFGTCSMGKVVDEKLAVLGLEGLFVADASVVPVPMTATATTLGVAIGTRCGEALAL